MMNVSFLAPVSSTTVIAVGVLIILNALVPAEANSVWSTRPLCEAKSSMASFVHGDRVFIGGGRTERGLTDKIEVYSAMSRGMNVETFRLQSARESMEGITMAVGKVGLFFGGEANGLAMGDAEVYDDGFWKPTAFPARSHCAVVSVGSKVIFHGGYGPEGNLLGEALVYDWLSDHGEETPLKPRALHAGVAAGSIALFAGGISDYEVTDEVDVYNNEGHWTTAHPLSIPRSNLAATSDSRLILFAGGQTAQSLPTAAVDIYNTLAHVYMTAKLTEARYDLAATTVGSLAVIAGGTSAHGPSAVVDIFDYTTYAWTLSTLSTARTRITAATVGYLALFAGGETAFGYSAVIDIMNIEPDTSTPTSFPTTAPSPRATPIPDSIDSNSPTPAPSPRPSPVDAPRYQPTPAPSTMA